MDRFEAMSILLLTVEKGSFTAAAKALGMPLATVSRKVAELEKHLGARLLVRSTRRLALTDAGTAYVIAAKRILEEVDEAERSASGEYEAPRGELVLTAPILFGRLHILPIVTAFLAAYPDINVRLLLSDRNLHLIEDHVDLAVRIGFLPESSLIATRVGTMRTVLCASPGLLAAFGPPRRPADLATMPCVSFDVQAETPAWRFGGTDGQGGEEVLLVPRLAVSTAEAAIDAAIDGVGVTRVLHYQCAAAVEAGRLEIILAAFEKPPLPVSLVHAARGALPLKTRMFLDFAANKLRRRLSAA